MRESACHCLRALPFCTVILHSCSIPVFCACVPSAKPAAPGHAAASPVECTSVDSCSASQALFEREGFLIDIGHICNSATSGRVSVTRPRMGHAHLRRQGVCAPGPETGLGLENMRHVISIHDVVSDTMHQFAPTYHNYVLYSNGGSKDAPKTVRAPAPTDA